MTDSFNVASAIQLAIGPAFLMVALGSLLNVMTNRLARIVDRTRDLEDQTIHEAAGPERDMHIAELNGLDRRIVRINMAITLCTLATLLICLVVASLFVAAQFALDLSLAIAAIFVLTMAVLIVALGFFLSEIYIAGFMLRVSKPFRAARRPLPARRDRKRRDPPEAT